MRPFVRALAAALAVAGMALPAAAAPAPYAWIEYAADGQPHVRVIPTETSCPAVSVDGVAVAMTLAVPVTPAFGRPLCDVAIAARAASVKVGDRVLPPLAHDVERIAVFGDTGCRIKGTIVQNCNDPAAWPFARIAASIAKEHPDLIVHVGDYQYRETACPVRNARCAGTPFGDDWDAWDADFFTPAAPLFATAPLIFARGNHEECDRAGLGWSRYLAPAPSATCIDHEATAIASFDGLRIANVDSAHGDENNPDPALFETDERIADAASQGRETWLLTHRPPIAYLNAHGAKDPNGPDLAAIVSGHIHLFAALSFAGAPPTILVGTGGDLLAQPTPELTSVAKATVESRFGYAIFEKTGEGWKISERDPDGAEHRTCTLVARVVSCAN